MTDGETTWPAQDFFAVYCKHCFQRIFMDADQARAWVRDQ